MALKESLRQEEERKSADEIKTQKPEASLLDISDPWANAQQSTSTSVVTNQPAALNQPNPVAMDPFNLGMPMPNNVGQPQAQQPPAQLPPPSNPWGSQMPSMPQQSTAQPGVSANPMNADPWGAASAIPTGASTNTFAAASTGQQPVGMSTMNSTMAPSQIDPWGNSGLSVEQPNSSALAPSPMNMDPFGGLGAGDAGIGQEKVVEKPRGRTPDLGKQFLGDAGADLVNLDTIVANPAKPTSSNIRSVSPNVFTQAPGYPAPAQSTNPFSSNVNQNTGSVFSGGMTTNNPFAAQPVGRTLNQIMAEQNPAGGNQSTNTSNLFQSVDPLFPTSQPMQPSNTNSNTNANPFF